MSAGPFVLRRDFIQYDAEPNWALLNCSSQSCADASCDTVAVPGQALDQYHQFRQRVDCSVFHKFHTSYNVSYTVGAPVLEGRTLRFNITEAFWEHSIEQVGGSSFEILLLCSASTVVCTAMDTFKAGKYTVSCLMPKRGTYSTDWRVSVTVQYVKFGAFHNPLAAIADGAFLIALPFDQLIHNCSVLLPPSSSAEEPARLCSARDISESTGNWLDDTWQYDSCFLKPYAQTDLQPCVRKLHSVQIVGASHCRFLHDAVLDLLGGNLSSLDVRHHDAVFDKFGYKVGFQWVATASDMRRALPKLAPEGVMVLQTGTWDLWRKGADVFLDDMKAIIDIISSWQNKTTVFWLQIPPIAFLSDNQGIGRNNPTMAAVHEWILPRLRRAGAYIIPYHDIALPRKTDYACTRHYQCTSAEHLVIHQTVGDQVFQVVLNALCNSDV